MYDTRRKCIEKGETTPGSPTRSTAQAVELGSVVQGLQEHVVELSRELDSELLCNLSRAQIVMIGDMTHGTQEFYEERARVTERLIEEQVMINQSFYNGCIEAVLDFVCALLTNTSPSHCAQSADQPAREEGEGTNDFSHGPSWRILSDFRLLQVNEVPGAYTRHKFLASNTSSELNASLCFLGR